MEWIQEYSGVIAIILATAAILYGLYRSGSKNDYSGDLQEYKLKTQIESLSKEVKDLKAAQESFVRQFALQQELIDKLRTQIDEQRDRIQELELENERLRKITSRNHLRDVLLAVIGPDAPGSKETEKMGLDLASLRQAVKGSAIHLRSIENATQGSITSTLARNSIDGNPIRYIHIASHAMPNGILLSDGIMSAKYLSDVIPPGVDVIVINGCSSEMMGDPLGASANYVITTNRDISHEEAANFAQLFWSAIASGYSVENAFSSASSRMSPRFREGMYLHKSVGVN